MKKAVLFFGLIILGLTVYSQDLRFTKGDIVPGKIKNGRNYEDFISGRINVSDNAGAAYAFVKAQLVVTPKTGKPLVLVLSQNFLTTEQAKQVIQVDGEGTVYAFKNVVIKDGNGKEYIIAEVQFEFPALIGE